ncbi:MAG: hypothetical protein GY943_01235 [Chloroflexi bacterium]|nr:hypothetical protein [Chloroflexota bacterium]
MRDYISAITIRATEKLEAELASLGIQNLNIKETDAAPLGKLRKLELKVYLDNPRLSDFLELIDRHGMVGAYATEFTKEDFKNAGWFEIRAKSWLGYPKPEHSWKENTYDLEAPDYCNLCGVGLVQVNPFRLGSNQPKAKRASFFAPGWVFDQVFITTNVHKIFNQQGITGADYLAPLKAKTKQPFDNLWQLVIRNRLQNALLNHSDFDQKLCGECGRLAHRASARAKKFDKTAFVNAPDIVRSEEWFGNGQISKQLIIVSRKFVDLVLANKWRGLKMQPIILSS